MHSFIGLNDSDYTEVRNWWSHPVEGCKPEPRVNIRLDGRGDTWTALSFGPGALPVLRLVVAELEEIDRDLQSQAEAVRDAKSEAERKPMEVRS